MERARELLASEPGYILLLFALFVIPRMLQRYRIPAAITSLALGAACAIGADLFTEDSTVHLLSTFGIVGLFLFAGLEVDLAELYRHWAVLLQHLGSRLMLVAGAAWAAAWFLDLAPRPAWLVALALLTPSTGFILDSLKDLNLSEAEGYWVKTKAIATEMLALAIMFAVLQSTAPRQFLIASAAVAALVAVLPLLLRVFAAVVAPYAPNSEFAFLVMLAVLGAYVTRQLGLYYLVGAFIVGLAARRFREQLPAIASEQMLHAVAMFASFFIPFYFFGAGLALRSEAFVPEAFVIGAIFVVLGIPIRLGTVALQRKIALGETMARGLRVAIPMLPTLVFSLVLVEILRERFAVPETVLGGIVLYTLVNTLAPGLLLGMPTPEFEAVDVPAGRGGG